MLWRRGAVSSNDWAIWRDMEGGAAWRRMIRQRIVMATREYMGRELRT